MRNYLHRVRHCAAAILAAAVLGGCATSPSAPVSEQSAAPPGPGSGAVAQKLYSQLERWRGTRYRLGGLGRNGIDCSGLTYVVYRDVFGEQLPRTAGEQTGVGHAVKRRVLAPGDLVFFKTGVLQRHVGIYVDDGMFLHASPSSGVRLSSLDNSYWRDRYWQARRLPVVQAELGGRDT